MPFTDKSRNLRIYFYSLMIAAGPLVTFYGFASAEEVALWIGAGGTALGLPAGTVALKNLTPKAKPKPEQPATAVADIEPAERPAEEVLPSEAFVQAEFVGTPGSLDEQREAVRLENALDRAQHGGEVETSDPNAPDDMEHYNQFEDVTDQTLPDDAEHYDQFEDVTGRDEPDERAR